jgi:hypothetical protein
VLDDRPAMKKFNRRRNKVFYAYHLLFLENADAWRLKDGWFKTWWLLLVRAASIPEDQIS